MSPTRHLLLLLGFFGCPTDEPAEDDDSTEADDPGCNEDEDCRFETGLEICEAALCVEGDRNNSADEAQLVEYGDNADLVIAPAGDVDWFRFHGTAGDLVMILASADDVDELDVVIEFWNPQGDPVGFNDNFDRVGDYAPDARYYGGVSETGTWTWSIQDRRSWADDPGEPPRGGSRLDYTTAIVDDGIDTGLSSAPEPNDDASDATSWVLEDANNNYSLGGFFTPAGDEDWLSLELNPGETLRVYGFPNSGGTAMPRVTVLLPDGATEVGSWDGLAWDEEHRIALPILDEGPHYLRVEDLAGGGPRAWYVLHAARDGVDEGHPAENEPNDDPGQPLVVDPGSDHVLWGRIWAPGDVDRFVVDTIAGDRVTVHCEQTIFLEDTRLMVSLLDDQGTILAEEDWDGDSGPVYALEEVAGASVVEVREQDPDAGGPDRFYQISISILR